MQERQDTSWASHRYGLPHVGLRTLVIAFLAYIRSVAQSGPSPLEAAVWYFRFRPL